MTVYSEVKNERPEQTAGCDRVDVKEGIRKRQNESDKVKLMR